jgi:hypothetical protein
MLLGLTQIAVVRINKMYQTHQVVFKRIGHSATDIHFHYVRIPVNLSKIIQTPSKAMETKEGSIKNVYQQLLMYYKDQQRGNVADKHQAHLAAQLLMDSSDFIMNRWSTQLISIKNDILSVTLTLPTSNTGTERQLELLFGLGATLFGLYNYINHNADNMQITKNTQSISSLTHFSEIQENYLKHLEIEVANNGYLYIHSLKFNPAILVSACQDITFQTSVISDKFLSTIQQLQVKRLSPLYCGQTPFKHLQLKAQKSNMDLLISALSDLFQIDVSYFYKSSTKELNIFLHVPMV